MVKKQLSSEEVARRILDVLKRGKPVHVLRDLAQESGFRGVYSMDFKAGLNLLIDQKIVKLRQSGWKSEKRGGHNHPKSAILLADIYEVEMFEGELRPEGHAQLEPEQLPTSDDFTLVPIKTVCGEESYISKSAFERERGGNNFWIARATLNALKLPTLPGEEACNPT